MRIDINTQTAKEVTDGVVYGTGKVTCLSKELDVVGYYCCGQVGVQLFSDLQDLVELRVVVLCDDLHRKQASGSSLLPGLHFSQGNKVKQGLELHCRQGLGDCLTVGLWLSVNGSYAIGGFSLDICHLYHGWYEVKALQQAWLLCTDESMAVRCLTQEKLVLQACFWAFRSPRRCLILASLETTGCHSIPSHTWTGPKTSVVTSSKFPGFRISFKGTLTAVGTMAPYRSGIV